MHYNFSQIRLKRKCGLRHSRLKNNKNVKLDPISSQIRLKRKCGLCFYFLFIFIKICKQTNKLTNGQEKKSLHFSDLKVLISTNYPFSINNENPSVEKHMSKKLTLSSISCTNTPTCEIFSFSFSKNKKNRDRQREILLQRSELCRGDTREMCLDGLLLGPGGAAKSTECTHFA